MSWLGRIGNVFSFKRISGQIAALVLGSLILIHASIAGYFLLSRPDPSSFVNEPVHQVALAAMIIAKTPASDRELVLRNIDLAFPHLRLRYVDQAPVTPPDKGTPSSGVVRRVGNDVEFIERVAPDTLMFHLSNGGALEAFVGKPRTPPFITGLWTTTFLFLVVSISLLGVWAGRALSAPLSAFARAAESFSVDRSAAPLPENGPEEIKLAARALNAMRDRITSLMNDRTRLLAAISHDLRIPITRMRLRSEFVEDETYRRKTLRDLDQMQAMLESVLTLLRSGSLAATTPVDVAALLRIVCDEFADSGKSVHFHGPSRMISAVRPEDIRRAVTNLIENAVRHGNAVHVTLNSGDEKATITIDDDGPGIPSDKKNAMMEPFVRGDEARAMEEGSGFGLGLSIAQMIVQAHGGSLCLRDNQPQGLRVVISLPRKTNEA